jgi:hypothetical protein
MDDQIVRITPNGVQAVTPLYNAPGAGIKHDTGKLQWNLLPLKYLRGTVRVLMFGAKKYAPWNWRKGMPWTQPYNALQRHLDAWIEGEDIDPETGENHLDHAMCELVFLRCFVEEHPDKDDRFKKP